MNHRRRLLPGLIAVIGALGAPLLHAQVINLGNFAPETDISGDTDKRLVVGDVSEFPGTRYAAVAFSTGAQPIQITSVDLALQSDSSNLDGLQLLVTAADLPSFGPALVSFSTESSVPNPAARFEFTPDSAVTLDANTTYYLQLQASSSYGFFWMGAENDSAILSDYSTYNGGGYGIYTSLPNSDLGAYYITATVVPEVSTVGLLVLGAAAFTGLVSRRRRLRAKASAF